MKSELEKMKSHADDIVKKIWDLLGQIRKLQSEINTRYIDDRSDALASNIEELYENELYEIGDLINLAFWQSYKISCYLALTKWRAGQLYKSKATLEPF